MTQAFNDRTPLQRLLWLGGVVKAANGKTVEETASGNPCVFTTDLSKPLSRLALSLLPRQSGTGDPSPENIRPLLPWGEVGTWHGGKNLAEYITDYAPTVGANNGTVKLFEVTLQKGTYTFSCKQSVSVPTSTRNTLAVTIGAGGYKYENVSANYNPVGLIHSLTFTLTEENKCSFYIWCHTPSVSATYNEWQVEFGEQASAYVPYVPIVPYPVNLRKNLFPQRTVSLGKPNGRTASVSFDSPLPVGTYSVSYNRSGTYTGASFGIQAFSGSTNVGSFNQNTGKLTTTGEADRIYFYMGQTAYDDNETLIFDDFQLEQGEQATAYQPYIPPVYGCELDLTTGEVWGTNRVQVFNGSETLTKYGSYTGGIRVNSNLVDDAVQGDRNAISNIAVIEANLPSSITQLGFRVSGGTGRLAIFVPDSMFNGEATVEKFKAWLAENNLAICVTLDTPVLLATLTPQQINAIIGVNTVWSDADEIELTYLKKG